MYAGWGEAEIADDLIRRVIAKYSSMIKLDQTIAFNEGARIYILHAYALGVEDGHSSLLDAIDHANALRNSVPG